MPALLALVYKQHTVIGATERQALVARNPRSVFADNEAHSLRMAWVHRTQYLIQVVHFHESNSGGAIYTAHDCCVIACWQICDDCRFPSISWSQSAIDDFLNLILCDNAADYRSLPIIVGGNQSARAIVQFQCRISQYIGHPKWSKLRANGANNDILWCDPLDDEASNHHVVVCLDKAASTDVAKD